MSRALLWPAVITLSATTMALVAVFELGPPLAPLIAFWFVFVCPGLPYVRLLGLGEPLTEFLLAIALSISTEGVVSLVMLRGASWTAQRMLIVMIIITLVGVILDARRAISRQRAPLVSGVARMASQFPGSGERLTT